MKNIFIIFLILFGVIQVPMKMKNIKKMLNPSILLITSLLLMSLSIPKDSLDGYSNEKSKARTIFA